MRKLTRHLLISFIASATGLKLAAQQNTPPPAVEVSDVLPDDAKMLARFTLQLTALDAALASTPDRIELLSQRGDSHLFLSHFPEAVADFEKMIALDPRQDAPHWRLGIAYYFAGNFAKSARQFEKYHAYDGGDRENGIWKFLADAQSLGLEPARRAMLVYTRFDREPFPSLYAMFAGQMTTADFFADLAKRGLAIEPRVAFFAHYYAGLHESLLAHPAEALLHVRKALATHPSTPDAPEPSYMWQIARVHYRSLSRTRP